MMAIETSKPRYTVVIQWDEDSGNYVVSLPEWGPYCKTNGATYEEAAKNAQEVLELLLDGERNPPAAKLFEYPGADVVVSENPEKELHGSGLKPSRKSA